MVLPKLDGGIGNRRVVTSGNLLDCRSNFGKRVPLTRKTLPGACSFVNPDPGHSTLRRWRRLLPPGSSRLGEEGVFLALGLDEVRTNNLQPASEQALGQSSRRGQCTGTHFN